MTQIFREAQWGTVVPRSAVCASRSAGRYKEGNVAQGVGCCVQEGSGSLVADLQPASLLLSFFFLFFFLAWDFVYIGKVFLLTAACCVSEN